MSHKVQFKLPLIIFSSIPFLFTTSAYSAGFALIENSASGMGNAFAGASAVAEDSSTVWFNPAGMTYLTETLNGKAQVSSSGHILSTNTKFTDKGTSAPASLLSTIDGVKDSDEGHNGLIPNIYYVKQLKPHLSFGVSVNAPFGSGNEYDEDWVGRYQATKTALKTINVNPSLSWKANDKFSIGGGISAQYIHVSLGKALDSAAACRSIAIPAGSTAIWNNVCNTQYPNASKVEKDSQVLVEGDDISFGFNLGLLYQPTQKTRLGASYRSSIKHDLEGDIKFDLHAGLKSIVPALEAKGVKRLSNRDITASVDLPETISLSLVHQINPRLELLGDVTWMNWSSFPELLISDAETGDTVTNTPEEWEDVARFSLGANYKYSDKLTLRTGVALDEEAIPSEKLRTPRMSGNDRTWLSFGAGYKMNKKTSFDFGYSHLFLDETAIDNTDEAGYTVKGLYDTSVNIYSAQVNYNF